MLGLLSWALAESSASPLEFYQRLGFQDELLAPLEDKLSCVSRLLLEPFLKQDRYNLQEWNLGPRMNELLGDLRWNFRVAGPPALLHFMRALSGLIKQLQSLGEPVNWHNELTSLLDLPAPPPPSSVKEESPPELGEATFLKLTVSEKGKTKVQLTFGLQVLESLESLMEDDLLTKLRLQNISPGEIGRDAIEQGYPKKELFSLSEGEKLVRVWLE
jgi:hypothetical protein